MKTDKQKQITLIFSITLINLTIYLITQAFFSYGMFRDEYYYLACANRLDFGYVDHPPLSIWILGFWKMLFGDSMFVCTPGACYYLFFKFSCFGLINTKTRWGKISDCLSNDFVYAHTYFSWNEYNLFYEYF